MAMYLGGWPLSNVSICLQCEKIRFSANFHAAVFKIISKLVLFIHHKTFLYFRLFILRRGMYQRPTNGS